jgi:hypothetical protein
MKIWTLLLLSLIASGCASEPRTPPPDWEAAAREEGQEAANAVEIPLLCAIPWDPTRDECWKAIVGIAGANKDAVVAAEAGYDRSVAAGKLQYELSLFWHDLLEEERKGRALDEWYFRSVIVLGLLIGSVL